MLRIGLEQGDKECGQCKSHSQRLGWQKQRAANQENFNEYRPSTRRGGIAQLVLLG